MNNVLAVDDQRVKDVCTSEYKTARSSVRVGVYGHVVISKVPTIKRHRTARVDCVDDYA